MTRDPRDPRQTQGQSPEQLAAVYRGIKAPANLRLRIDAALPEHRARPSSWLWQPVTAGAALLLVLVVLGPRLVEKPDTAVPGAVPSLARLSAALPDKPNTALPSLAQVRGVKGPAMPTRPAALPEPDPQSRLQDESFQFNVVKEKTHG